MFKHPNRITRYIQMTTRLTNRNENADLILLLPLRISRQKATNIFHNALLGTVAANKKNIEKQPQSRSGVTTP